VTYKPDDVLRWVAAPNRTDQVQHTSDVDGRVRRVTFILGKAARDNFLKAMRAQVKLQAAASVTRV
jgi:hypothetical protein